MGVAHWKYRGCSAEQRDHGHLAGLGRQMMVTAGRIVVPVMFLSL